MYFKYFGLREAPFNLTPDPRFYFSSSLHREALAALYYGIKTKKGFIVVTGEVGTGKTTLLRKLLRSLEVTHHSVFIFNTLLTFDELLTYTLRDLGMEPGGTGRAALIQQLNEFLLENQKKGHSVSLLIDEAQQLGEEALEAIRFLSNLETDREKLIQIILVGQPELEEKLDRPSLRQLKQRVSLWSRLGQLSENDTEAYIRHRLEVAGYRGPALFEPSAIKLIAESASGTPRLINSICDNALLTVFAMSQKLVSVKIVQDVIRDLRLVPAAGSDSPTVEPKGFQEAPAKLLSSAAEGKRAMGGINSRVSGELKTGTGASLQSSSAMDSDPGYNYNFDLRRDSAVRRQAAQEQLAKPVQARNITPISELRDRRSEDRGRMLESVETARPQIIGASREFGAARRRGPLPGGNQIISAEFLTDLIRALTDAMGPMASLVIRDQAAKLGESAERFPIDRLPDLVNEIKLEILNDGLRQRFEKDVATQIRQYWIDPE